VHHSTILTVKIPTRCNSVIKILLSLILNEAQHVSGETPSIIRSLKLHKQLLVLHTWKVVGRAVVGPCQVAYERVQTAAAAAVAVAPAAAAAAAAASSSSSRLQSAPSHTLPDNVQQLHVRQPSTYAKPEAACAVLGS